MGYQPGKYSGQRHASCLEGPKTRNAKIVHIDVYHNGTSKQADMALIIKPGTDAALACAVMHILFRDGYATSIISKAIPIARMRCDII